MAWTSVLHRVGQESVVNLLPTYVLLVGSSVLGTMSYCIVRAVKGSRQWSVVWPCRAVPLEQPLSACVGSPQHELMALLL